MTCPCPCQVYVKNNIFVVRKGSIQHVRSIYTTDHNEDLTHKHNETQEEVLSMSLHSFGQEVHSCPLIFFNTNSVISITTTGIFFLRAVVWMVRTHC
jgi:hypothetical protein